jgi:uncharacterized membrane protein
MSWKAIAFSEAGTSHQQSGLTCQDYAKFIKLNDFGETVNDGDIIIGAVSKGSEGCKHSDIGSQLAVETVLNYLQDRIKFVGVNEAKKNCLLDISKEEADLVVRQFFLQTVEKVSKNLDIKSQELRCYPQDLSCTLLVVIATSKWLAAMRIGDGFIVIKQPESEYQLLFDPIRRESANKTTFLPASNALELMQFKISFGVQEFIFTSTDSLEILAFDITEDFQMSFFDCCREVIEKHSEDSGKRIIQSWLQSEYINNVTVNDTIILVCFYKSLLSELNDCNQLLTQEVDQLHRQLLDLQSDNQALTEQISQVNQQVSKLLDENQSLNKETQQMPSSSQLLSLSSQNESLTQKLDYTNTKLWQQGQRLNIIKNLAITSTVIATALAGLSLFQYYERNQVIRQIEQLKLDNNLSLNEKIIKISKYNDNIKKIVIFKTTTTVESLDKQLVKVIEKSDCYSKNTISQNQKPTLNDVVNTLNQKLESVENKLDCAIQERKDLKTRINELEKSTYVNFCNKTSYQTINAAFAYWDGNGLRSKGWYPVKSGECKEVSVAQNYNGNVYVYAEYNSGEISWAGQYSFCVNLVDSFSISESDKVICSGSNQKSVKMSAWSVSPGTNNWNLSQ